MGRAGRNRRGRAPEEHVRPMRQAVMFAVLLGWANLAPAADPTVHVLAPGFKVQALPLRLTNINALAFSPEGKLYAVAYDGRIHRLVDTNGDGLEDRAEPYWDKEGVLISPIQGVWGPEGLYVSSHLKVSLLRDDNHDGKADREEIV